MNKNRLALLLPLTVAVLCGCAGAPSRAPEANYLVSAIQQATHDDLLTAGLGATGLMNPVPPAFADAAVPTAAELRRRAIWTNWRGIADLAPGGGYGQLYGSLEAVPGREFHAFARLPGARQPHRVMVQLPDDFDPDKRCILVTASSGSRGIYGSIALAGSWGLSHGCAVAYTDKGAGTGYVDTGTGGGVRLDGTRSADLMENVEFNAPGHAGKGVAPIAVKHAHSGDNPEADWGEHVLQAARFALEVLAVAQPQLAPFTAGNTRVIAVGVSNGGGAVLRAAELPGELIDGVVAISPNVLAGDGGRALYDYSTEAALFMPCALNAAAFDAVALARPGGARPPAATARCASLYQAGLLGAADSATQAEQARSHLHRHGWSDGALAAGAISTAFDLWRAVNITYASAYARRAVGSMPCGQAFHVVDGTGAPTAASAALQATWWSDASGIPPGAGVAITDTLASGNDASWPAGVCLRSLWQGEGAEADEVRRGVRATKAALPRAGLPVLVMHGAEDGLVPEAFSGGAYAAWAQREGRDVRYWRVRNAQHFDAFLGLPILAAQYVPMMPYAYHGLDAMWAHLAQGAPLPGSAEIQTRPRAWTGASLAPLSAENLGTMP